MFQKIKLNATLCFVILGVVSCNSLKKEKTELSKRPNIVLFLWMI